MQSLPSWCQGLIFTSTIYTSSLKLTAADLKCNGSSQTGRVTAQPIEISPGNRSGPDAEVSPKAFNDWNPRLTM